MKAILILDMPIDCEGCDMFFVDKDFKCYRCKANDMVIGDEIVRQKWCPLKPLPQKKEVDENHKMAQWNNDCDIAYNAGYNTCLEDILGGKEE